MENFYMTVAEVAKLLRLKERTLYSRVARKDVLSESVQGRILIPKTEILKLLDEQKKKRRLPLDFTPFPI